MRHADPTPKMNNRHLTFHHLGLAVRQPESAIAFFSGLGYQVGDMVFDHEQNVRLAMCTHPTEPAVEIIWPGDTKGPIDGLLRRFPPGVVYHMCYETDDLPAALSGLEEAGLRVVVVSPAKPAVLFGGRNVSFYNVMGIGLVEILE